MLEKLSFRVLTTYAVEFCLELFLIWWHWGPRKPFALESAACVMGNVEDEN
jgi:hypothetical protein